MLILTSTSGVHSGTSEKQQKNKINFLFLHQNIWDWKLLIETLNSDFI